MVRPDAATIDTAADRSPEVSTGLHTLIWSASWDVAMRAVGGTWTGLILSVNVSRLWTFIEANRATMPGLPFWSAVASRVAAMAFIATLFIFFLVRLKPVAKAVGMGPRIMALAGTLLPTLMALMPRYEASAALNVASFACIGVSSALSAYGFLHLNRSASIMAEARRLVTTGPYRMVRHPIYLFEEISVIGVALTVVWPPRTAVVAGLILVGHAWCQVRRMRAEERVLETSFPEYSAYKTRTPWRVVPGVY